MIDWNVGLMRHLGMRFPEVGPDRVVAELDLGENLATVGGAIRAESSALHRGKRTHAWQTRVTDASGRLLSLAIQTQMILDK